MIFTWFSLLLVLVLFTQLCILGRKHENGERRDKVQPSPVSII